VAAARNRGFALTNPASEFVIFLDSDDLWVPDALATLLEMLEKHPEYVASHCLARCIDADGQPIPGDDLQQRSRDRHGFRGGHLVAVPPDQPTTFADLVYHTWIVTPGTQLVRRDVLVRVGGFDPATDPADDADLVIRLSRHGDIGFVDRALLAWRRHPDTLTNMSRRWGTAALRVRAKTLTEPSNTPEQTRAMRLAYRQAIGSMLREAWNALTRQNFRGAIHQSLKAGNLYQAYVRANVQRLTRRMIATVGKHGG
jgi:GT2 family glycosyltransferase